MQHLTDGHKAWIRQHMKATAEKFISDMEREAAQGADIEQLMSLLYLTEGMSAPMPSQPTPPDEPEDKS